MPATLNLIQPDGQCFSVKFITQVRKPVGNLAAIHFHRESFSHDVVFEPLNRFHQLVRAGIDRS